MRTNPRSQRNGVSQGMTLGLLLNSYNELPTVKAAVELSFAGAWRIWPRRHFFSQVNTDLAHGSDEWNVIARTDEGKRVFGLRWSGDGYRWVITTRDVDWTVNEPDDVDHAVSGVGVDVHGHSGPSDQCVRAVRAIELSVR